MSPWGGRDPYSSSKGCAELLTTAYRASFFSGSTRTAAIASARAGNVIGGGDWSADRLVPDLLNAFERRQPATVRNPEATRPWQHVLEPLAGYLALAEALVTGGERFAEGWNFGPGEAGTRPVNWMAVQLSALWGEGAAWTPSGEGGAAPHEARHLKLDSSKARAMLNWRPAWRLETALEAVVDWQKAYLSGRDMRAVTAQQISDYVDAMAE